MFIYDKKKKMKMLMMEEGVCEKDILLVESKKKAKYLPKRQ